MGWIISILTNSADGRIAGLLFLFAGLGAGIDLGGGFPAIQHFILRILLWRMESVPLMNYPKFLNRAVYHIFLLRVGSGYIFIHRLLLDYLASRNLSV